VKPPITPGFDVLGVLGKNDASCQWLILLIQVALSTPTYVFLEYLHSILSDFAKYSSLFSKLWDVQHHAVSLAVVRTTVV